jgi:hypothetical protein
MSTLETPKIFISYSWSNPEHEELVLDLGESLMADGVDILLDKWELRDGGDPISFMESMVNDSSITKIIMVIDSKYTERANARQGGVGTESTILSNELYKKRDKNKIVAVIAEPGAHPPTFYAGRLYIDLSNQDNYAEEYEKLVRWAFDRYKYEKPKTIGKPPSFITADESAVVLHTNTEFRMALDALEKGKTNTSGNVKSYLNKLDSELVKLSVEGNSSQEISKNFIKNLTGFQPHLLEFQKIVDSICIHNQDSKIHKHIRYFFESLLNHLQIIPNGNRAEHDLAIYEFIIYQLFLSYIALLLRHEEFSELKEILDELFITPKNFHKYHIGGKHTDFRVFRPTNDRLAYKELMGEKISPLAALLKDLNTGDIINFDQIVETDIFLYLKSLVILSQNGEGYQWWPYTGLYRSEYDNSLRVFTKSEKPTYFNDVKNALGIENLAFIKHMIPEEYDWQNRYIPRWSDSGAILNIRSLTNYEKLEPPSTNILDIL